jgi:DNA-binding LytR/AlgR family response regulator
MLTNPKNKMTNGVFWITIPSYRHAERPWYFRFKNVSMKNYFFTKQNGQVIRLDFEKIRYVEGRGNYCKIVMDGHQTVLLLRTMKEVESFLPGEYFIRIHKSYIISLNHIISIEGRQINLSGDATLPVGELFRQNINSFVTANML